jgi:hypothetical protein
VNSPQVLIDGDPIVYRVGFASQSRNIHCVVEQPETNQMEQIRFSNKTERNKWLADNQGWYVASEEEEIIPEPIENALGGVKRLLREIGTETDSDNLHVILSESTGKGNFRHAIAQQAPYKGNRKLPRPVHYHNIREYLVEHWGAQVVATREADDEIAIRANRYRAQGIPYVVATIDKDLDQIPGPHYDYAKKVSYQVTADDARRAFWIQALSGDPTDNIPGCWRVGDDRAPKIVDQWLSNGFDDSQMFQALIAEYEKSKKFGTCPYRDRPSVEIALETAQLVWMQDTPCVVWAPAGVERKRIPCELDD